MCLFFLLPCYQIPKQLYNIMHGTLPSQSRPSSIYIMTLHWQICFGRNVTASWITFCDNVLFQCKSRDVGLLQGWIVKCEGVGPGPKPNHWKSYSSKKKPKASSWLPCSQVHHQEKNKSSQSNTLAATRVIIRTNSIFTRNSHVFSGKCHPSWKISSTKLIAWLTLPFV